MKKNDTVTAEVIAVNDGGIEVQVGEMTAFIRRADLSRDRSEQRPERFAVGDKVDAKVTAFDKAKRQLSLSIKAREISDEKEAVAQYGSSNSGASLGDILGAALAKSQGKKDEAKTAYQAAWKAMDSKLEYRQLIDAKLTALGAAPAASGVAP